MPIPDKSLILYMALKVFPHAIILSEVYWMEGFSSRIKIEKMVNNYVSSCNSEYVIKKYC